MKRAEYPDETKPMRMVFISAGFVDLVNNVAHAKAIDKRPKHPAWTVYFLPNDVKVAKLKKEMAKIEKDFFAGKEDKD